MNLKRKEGMALIIVLCFVLLLVLVAISFMVTSLTEIRMVEKQNASIKAFYVAEAGLEDVIDRIENDFTTYRDIPSTTPMTVTGSVGEGTYAVNIPKPTHPEDSDIYNFDITSRGQVDNITREIRRLVEVEVELTWDFEDYIIYISGNTGTISQETTVDGDVYTNGDLSIDSDSYIDGNVKTSASITKGDGVVITGSELPNSEPLTTPTLTTTYYDGEISTASIQEEGDLDISGSISGTTYVNGQANITGNITGPGTIVATGKIVVNQTLTIGDDITLIADDSLEVAKQYVVGKKCTLYSSTLITIAKEGPGSIGSSEAGSGSVIITPGTISIDKDNTIYGFIFAGNAALLDKECNIAGNVVSGNISAIAKEGSYTLNKDLVDFSSIVGLDSPTDIEATSTTQSWEEVPGI